MAAAWRFEGGTLHERGHYDAVAGSIREALLRVFATTYSPSVQESLYRMGEEAFAAAPDIREISLRMPDPIQVNLKAEEDGGRTSVWEPESSRVR